MNILIQLGHPAHFHLYKNVIRSLKEKGHSIFILIKTKDILEQLLQEEGLEYVNIYSSVRGDTKYSIIKAIITRLWRIALFSIKHHIDLLTGSSAEIAIVGKLLHRHSVILGEDDAAIIPEFIKMAKPFMDSYLTPEACDMGSIENRVIKYRGYQKLAYLHPNCFTPNREIASKYVNVEKPYFIIRFAQLKAYHDLHADASGINTELAHKIISILKPHGQVYITSERKLDDDLEIYRLSINPLDIHHVLFYSTLYIGDSQSMAVESALLGVPNIRFNDFVGKIGILNELEDKYHLTIGIPASNKEALLCKIDEIIKKQNIKEIYQENRKAMLSDVIDVNSFYSWFFENYPDSKHILKKNPDYQFKFK